MNFSSKPLATACISALNKGLSFAPTTSTNDFDTIIDFQKFFRSLRLKELFYKDTAPQRTQESPGVIMDSDEITNVNLENDIDVSDLNVLTVPSKPLTRFKKKSTYIPPRNRNASLDTYCRLVDRDLRAVLKKKHEFKVYNNLPKIERDALVELRNDQTIIVRPADKGGAIVIQNLSDYEAEIERQLGDTNFYKKLSCDPSSRFKSMVHEKLKMWFDKGEFTKSEYEFMKNDFPVTPVIYTLPKVHKSQTVPLVGRPIVSSIGSLTSNISMFVDHCLKPWVTSLPSYTRDSMDFINRLKMTKLPNADCLLVTLDIASLYTNIPHSGGLEAVEFFLNQASTSKPSAECVSSLTELVLTTNYFLHGNDHYLQTKGTAMGSTMAPNYANLFMGFF